MARKCIVALVALLCSASAQAHVLAVPFPEIGSLRDAHKAAFAIFQTYAPPSNPQITCNLITGVASVGGPCTPTTTCNGDVQTVTRTATITNGVGGNRYLSVTTNAFAPGDVGKVIRIPGANVPIGATIATYTDAQNVVLSASANLFGPTSVAITYGTDDAPAFAAFNSWARANQGANNQVVLSIPNGSNCWFGSGTFYHVSVFNAFASGINNLIVEGAGATINSVGGIGFQLGQQGICPYGLADTNGCSARLQDVTPGDSAVTLTAASLAAGYVSRFSVNQWIMVGGLNPQAAFQSGGGSPPNMTYFEWRQITAVNAGTGVITLDRPLTKSYSSAWPAFTNGDAFEQDSGGPATLWKVGNSGPGGTQNSWNSTMEYRGLTISQDGQTYGRGRSITYRNVTFTGAHGGIPTENESFSAINTDYGFTNMETDKLVGTMLMDGVTIAQIVNQSTSTDSLIIRNSTITNRLDGGAKYTEITDTALNNFGPGIFAYGSTGPNNQTICTRCNITTLNYSLNYSSLSDNFFSKSSGIITMPFGAAQGSGPGQRYFVPGALLYYRVVSTNPPLGVGCCESFGSFQVGAITSDPWPALDNQTVSASVTSSIGSNSITVSGSSFSSGDIGKTIIIPGAANTASTQLRTWITGVSGSGPQTLTVYNNASLAQTAATQTLQWGTSNMYIQTNQSGGFPSVSAFTTGTYPSLMVLSSANFTCDACTGDVNAVGTNIQSGATPNKPLGSYISKSYTPTSAQGDLAGVPGRGIFKSLSINVTVAATSAGSVSLNPGGRFHWYMIDQNTPSAPTLSDWLPGNLSINLKQTGNRVITPSGVTCNGSPGACSGDNITAPTNIATMWLQQGAMTPYMGSTHTGAPAFTITLQTDPVQ